MEATYAQIQKKPSAAASAASTAASSQSQYPAPAGQDYDMQQQGQGYSSQQIDGNFIKFSLGTNREKFSALVFRDEPATQPDEVAEGPCRHVPRDSR